MTGRLGLRSLYLMYRILSFPDRMKGFLHYRLIILFCFLRFLVSLPDSYPHDYPGKHFSPAWQKMWVLLILPNDVCCNFITQISRSQRVAKYLTVESEGSGFMTASEELDRRSKDDCLLPDTLREYALNSLSIYHPHWWPQKLTELDLTETRSTRIVSMCVSVSCITD